MKRIYFVLFIVVIAFFTCNKLPLASAHKGNAAQKILNEILGPSYDRNIRAYNNASVGEDSPTIVSVNMYIRSIRDINHVRMEFVPQITFRMQWKDSRLAYAGKKDADKFSYLSLTAPDKIWIPDLFFSNEISGHRHDLLTPNLYVRIFPDGEVLFSVRLTLALSCPMILKNYPFDHQVCSMRMASYGYTTDDIIFKWKSMDPVMITSDLQLPKFAMTFFTTDYCDSHTNTGIYSCLRLDLRFKREISQYLTDIYIPCTMLVIIAWLTLWLDNNGIGSNGRLLMAIGTLLVMAHSIQSFNSTETPPVSYTMKIDIWTGICLTFVFSTIVEFVIVNYMARNQIFCSSSNSSGSAGGEGGNEQQGNSTTNNKSQRNIVEEFRNWENNGPNVIDMAMRIIYSVIFFFFVIIYYATSG